MRQDFGNGYKIDQAVDPLGFVELDLYCLRSVTGTATVTIDFLNHKRKFLASVTVTTGTTAKSLHKLVNDAAGTWSSTWTFGKVRAISATVWYNTGGNQIVGTNNGVTSGLEPTTSGSNSDQLTLGTVFGEV